MIIVVMGVSGSGKTTIGKLLAKRVKAIFADADDYHSDANKAKMAAGHPLTDEDRAPWLLTLNHLLRTWSAEGKSGVLACSALKETYRQALADGLSCEEMKVVLLDVPQQVIAARLQRRHHEYMNPVLLDNQLQTLEPPAQGLRIVNDHGPDRVVDEIVEGLKISPAV